MTIDMTKFKQNVLDLRVLQLNYLAIYTSHYFVVSQNATTVYLKWLLPFDFAN